MHADKECKLDYSSSPRGGKGEGVEMKGFGDGEISKAWIYKRPIFCLLDFVKMEINYTKLTTNREKGLYNKFALPPKHKKNTEW